MERYGRLQVGVHYKDLKVFKIAQMVKKVTRKNDDREWWAHTIHFVDPNGNKFTGEYLILEKEKTDFQLGKYTTFEVDLAAQYVDQIKPVFLGAKVSDEPEKKNYPIKPQGASMSASMAGSGASFALSYAKDIFVAQIAKGIHDGTDLSPMLEHAKMINGTLIEMHSEQQ